MILGFTGTSEEPTVQQIATLYEYFEHNEDIEGVHHGDCIGSDDEFDQIAIAFDLPRFIHPPKNPIKRANCHLKLVGVVKLFPEKNHIPRNHDIVDACDLLLATPKEDYEVLRSGTWATIRYALKIKKRVKIIWRAGDIKSFPEPMTERLKWIRSIA